MKQKQRMRASLRISVSREKPSTGYWKGGLYSAANDTETANDPRPQMIPKLDRKWSQDHKWSPQRTANDPAEKNWNGVELQWKWKYWKVKEPTKINLKKKTEKFLIGQWNKKFLKALEHNGIEGKHDYV